MNSVIVGIPCLLNGGTERQTLALAKALCQHGYNVTVVCYHEHQPAVVDWFQKAAIRVVLLDLARNVGTFRFIRRLAALFRDERPDIVHIQYIQPGLLPIIAARIAKVRKILATVHQPAHPYGWRARLLFRLAASLVTCFTCVSESVEKSWFDSSRVFDPQAGDQLPRHCTIYNAIDVQRIDEIVNRDKEIRFHARLKQGHGPLLGVVGRLRAEKGQGHVIAALPVLRERIPGTRLLIIGDGPDRQKLEQQAADLGVADAIAWLGEKSWEETIFWMGMLDLLVVPSVFEGFGLVAAEGMAIGLPVVASGVDGLREVIEDGVSGRLVPPGDVDALTLVIVELLEDEATRKVLGAAGSDRVWRLFSKDSFTISVKALYRNLLETA